MIQTIILFSLLSCGHPSTVDEGGCLILSTDEVVRVYDGDTITIRVEEWPPLFREIGVRLTGYDTPEIRGRCPWETIIAIQARDNLRSTIDQGDWIILRNLDTGKFFRISAELVVNGQSVAEPLIAAGLAREYEGGARQGWCE